MRRHHPSSTPNELVEPLRGSFDQPAHQELVQGLQLFYGWVLDGAQPPTGVDLIFNGSLTVEASLGMERPDVPSGLHEPDVSPNCGWFAEVDLGRLTKGTLHVTVVARGRDARGITIAERLFELIAPKLMGSIDLPAEGAALEGELIVVSGWAAIRGHAAARIEIAVNGRPQGCARLRLPRPDVAQEHRSLGQITGFEYATALPADIDVRTEITVRVTAFDGSSNSFPTRTVRRRPKRIPARDVERIAKLRHRNLESIRRSALNPVEEGTKLLVFTHDLAIGGGQLYLSELLTQIKPNISRCTVVSPGDGVLRAELERVGIDVVVTGRPLPMDPVTYEGHIRELSHFIVGSGADAVLLNTLGTWPAGDAAQRVGVPTVWAIHESFDLSHWLRAAYGHSQWHPYLGDRLVATLGGVDRLVFEAKATSDMFAAYAEPSRRLVVRYGVDTARIRTHAERHDRSASRASYSLPSHAVVLLSVGVVDTRKCPACLIEAFARLAPDHGDAVLVIIGDRPCPYSDVLHQLIDAAELGDRLRLLPVTRDIYEWYALSDVLVSASDIESLPRSMLEAMAFGLPTLSTDVFGVPEVIEDGRNGWLFAAGDMLALEQAVDRVLNLSAETRRAVGQAGRETAIRDFDSAGYGNAYRRLLEELTGKALGGTGTPLLDGRLGHSRTSQ